MTIGIALADGAVQADSPAFSRLVAEQIGAIVVETFIAIITLVALQTATFALSRFVTVLAVIDTVMIAVCALFNLGEDENLARWFCGGISGALAQALAYVINDTTPLVDLQPQDRFDVGWTPRRSATKAAWTVWSSATASPSAGGDQHPLHGQSQLDRLSLVVAVDRSLSRRRHLCLPYPAGEQDIPLDLKERAWTPVPGKKT